MDLKLEVNLSDAARSNDRHADMAKLSLTTRTSRAEQEADAQGAGRPAPEDLAESAPEWRADVDAMADDEWLTSHVSLRKSMPT